MENEDRSRTTSDRRIALLIDADNVSHGKIAAILAELSKYGTANIRRAYGDWANAHLRNWKDKLHNFAIRPIQQFSYSAGKNATDIALVIDAMELLYTEKLDAFCWASSDADFTPLDAVESQWTRCLRIWGTQNAHTVCECLHDFPLSR
ncbi:MULTISPECIES: NYN domain-containing protein [unclassified Mesorhizobium]|uniref:NYN domain-containing protein n=1 Tax=unclassified Mesorhizobium TaxID=325217 RepID=UPI001AECA55B|nr:MULTISPECIES: NYN domain-containing protein [unclassified Mesorhizobium]